MYLARSTPKDKPPHFVIIFKTRLESASKAALSYIWWKTVGIKNLPILYIVKIEVYDLNWSGWIQGKRTAVKLNCSAWNQKAQHISRDETEAGIIIMMIIIFFPKVLTVWQYGKLSF